MDARVSGVGVVDKSVRLLDMLEGSGPLSPAELAEASGFSRATTHRLTVALETHGLVRRDGDGRFTLGARLVALGHRATAGWSAGGRVRRVLAELRDATGESVQISVRDGDERLCVESLESPQELRTIVAAGTRLPLDRGSAGHVLADPDGAGKLGWVATVAERAPGVASVSAPVSLDGLAAAISVSGPIERMGPDPGARHGAAVAAAAARLAPKA